MVAILLLAGALSYFVPRGSFQRDEAGEIITGTYQSEGVHGIAFWRVLTAPVRVFATADAVTIIMISLFLLAKVIVPMTSTSMIQDFKACGGFLLLATGFRMMQLRAFPVADMIPAMVLVMPVSCAWSQWLLPLIS